ncbi:hypothetical protein [Streptomyces microflavus]|uniref:hypothetical protein n=1 Tax=Streptomyces microflavus TaxID=1919 RepID=UPI002E35E177|nr:hypothetical protein [Streptomyces microflavus]
MAQQISMEAALDACRQKIGEQAYENVLLRAQVAELEQRLNAAQAPSSTHYPQANSQDPDQALSAG